MVETREIRPQPGPQEQALACSADVLVFGGAAGGSKGGRCASVRWAIQNIPGFTEENYLNGIRVNCVLVPQEIRDMDSKVLTWDGKWKPFPELEVGDRIMNPDGQSQEIIQVHDRGIRDFYRVTFEDGTHVDCDDEHLWGFWEARCNSRRKTTSGPRPIYTDGDDSDLSTSDNWNVNYILRGRVRSTSWLKAEIDKGRRFIIPVSAPLNFTNLHRGRADRAYTYGALIGDGHIGQRISLHSADEWIFERALAPVDKWVFTNYSNPKTCKEAIIKDQWVRDWANNSGLHHKRSWEKFLPPGYLKESLEFRWNLAQGLFDTDGHAGGESNKASYCTTSQQLSEDVANLVRSLGFLAKISARRGVCYVDGVGEEKRMAYLVNIQGNQKHRLFSLPRKVEEAKATESMHWVGKRIESIEPIGQDYSRCITVSNPNHLYVTDGYNVTHNSFSLLLEALRHTNNPKFGAVLFRETCGQVTQEGGLWDTSEEIYFHAGGVPTKGRLEWNFPSGAKVSFGHLGSDAALTKYQGGQIALIGFDELTHFSEKSFFYLLSRNRSTSGVKPYIRATCNPDPNSWLVMGPDEDGKRRWGHGFISWWIDPETGFAIAERSGVVRWFIRSKGRIVWADSEAEITEKYPELKPKSASFIRSSLEDNKILMRIDPSYKASLQALHPVDRARLLEGNWKVVEESGTVFSRSWFKVCSLSEYKTIMRGVQQWSECRFWDFAATEAEVVNGQKKNDPCATAGVKICRVKLNGDFYYFVTGAAEEYWAPAKTNDLVVNTAQQDGPFTKVRWEMEPGAQSVRDTYSLVRILKGFDSAGMSPEVNKLMRSKPFATAASKGKVILVRESMDVDRFLSACQQFPATKDGRDLVDAASGAFAVVSETKGVYRETRVKLSR